MKTAIIIPARLDSTRLPRKLLLDQTGKSLIEHTYRAAQSSQLADHVLVATDSHEIESVVRSFGGIAVMTSAKHQSGTDRVAEAAAQLDAELIVNVQGDEPEISGDAIDRVVKILDSNQEAAIATLATPIFDRATLFDASYVKVVFDRGNRALYFSRSPIPTARDENFLNDYFGNSTKRRSACFFQHMGIYGYRRQFLEQVPRLEQSEAEKIESLEQLRFLDHGWPVFVDVVDHATAGIDTAEDYALFVNRWNNR